MEQIKYMQKRAEFLFQRDDPRMDWVAASRNTDA